MNTSAGEHSSDHESGGLDGLSYPRSRRWLGICYVGSVVILSIYILSSGCLASVLGPDLSFSAWFFKICRSLVCFILFSLPFDIAGFLIERAYGRTRKSFLSYYPLLSRGILRHSFLLLSVAVFSATVLHLFGTIGLVCSTVTLSLILIAKQTEVARLYCDMLFEEPSQELRSEFPRNREGSIPLLIADSDDLAFSGGIVGLPGGEAIVIPKHWLSCLSKQQLWAEVVRRNSVIASGGRLAGVVLAFVFVNLGVLISYQLTTIYSGFKPDTSIGIVTMSCWYTLWSFVGLLLLPYPSRQGVLEADRLAVKTAVSPELLFETMEMIDSYVEGEQSRSLVVDTIFHPIPTVEYRQSALYGDDVARRGAWHAARYAVFLSVVGLGLLSRAVHCNAGKPDLWAMLPAD